MDGLIWANSVIALSGAIVFIVSAFGIAIYIVRKTKW